MTSTETARAEQGDDVATDGDGSAHDNEGGAFSRKAFLQTTGAAFVGSALVTTPAHASSGQGGSARRVRIVGLEEHVAMPPLLDAYRRAGIPEISPYGFGDDPLARRLRDVGEGRLRDMDDQGVDAQVLSPVSPGVQNLPEADAIAAARDINDATADVVRGNPRRFGGWATVPTQNGEAAAAELERAVGQLGLSGAMVYGRTGDALLDAPQYESLWATAERLRVPIHFHPQTPTPQVMAAYYSGLDAGGIGFSLGTGGIGWYYDLGIQQLRMIFAGVFDRYPDLQVISGHWGELVLFYIDHAGILAPGNLPRPLLDYYRRNFWIAGSGTVSPRYQRWTAEAVGTDRMVYSTDYPYTFGSGDGYPYLDTSGGVGRTFLTRERSLSRREKIAIGSGNWQRLSNR